MGKVLVASSVSEERELVQLIKDCGYKNVIYTQSGNEARRISGQCDFELIIVNTPLRDEFGRDFAVKAAESTSSGIILICKPDIYEDLSDKLSCCGIFVVSAPLNRQAFVQAVKFVSASRQRMLGAGENLKLQNKADEIKLIDRAKKCLMQYLKFSEPQAHRYIEKQAMDTRQTRKEVAKRILSVYEN